MILKIFSGCTAFPEYLFPFIIKTFTTWIVEHRNPFTVGCIVYHCPYFSKKNHHHHQQQKNWKVKQTNKINKSYPGFESSGIVTEGFSLVNQTYCKESLQFLVEFSPKGHPYICSGFLPQNFLREQDQTINHSRRPLHKRGKICSSTINYWRTVPSTKLQFLSDKFLYWFFFIIASLIYWLA